MANQNIIILLNDILLEEQFNQINKFVESLREELYLQRLIYFCNTGKHLT